MNSDRLREIGALALWSLAAFLAAAMLTYREELPPLGEGGLVNLCGGVGQFLAGVLLHKFGFAAYLVVAVLVAEGLRQFRRNEVRPFALRMPGLILFMVVASACLSHLFPGASSTIPDPGGDVGVALQGLLMHEAGLGGLGGRITLLFLLLTTFLLASDFLYSQTCAQMVSWWDSKGGLGGVLLGRGGGPATKKRPTRKKAPAVVDADDADDEWEDDADEESEDEWEDPDAEWEDGDEEEEDEDEEDEDEEDEDEEDEDEEDDEEWDDVEAEEDWEEDEEEDEEEVDDEDEWEDDDEAVEEDDFEPEIIVNAATSDTEPEAPVVAEEPDDDFEVEILKPTERHTTEDPDAGPPPAPTPVTEESKPYEFPSLELLDPPVRVDLGNIEQSMHASARKLTQVLASFKVDARVVGVQRGPTITMFEVSMSVGTKLGRLRGLEDDLAMNLAAQTVRIVAPIPGKSTAGIEVPNETRESVGLRELFTWPKYKDDKYAIPIFLGKDSAGEPLITDLAAMPHVLVAGSTGAGKSVCLNTVIMSVLFKRTPEQVQLILIDPKMVELSLFQNVPHLMCPVVTDMKRAASILEWAVEKMEARYQLLHDAGVRNIYSYNKLGEKRLKDRLAETRGEENIENTLPFIVIVIDELADLMMTSAKDVEGSITRLAQKSRAVGIHVILATQRPSTNVITGLIKANLPTRIGFRVASKIDSRVILDTNGAEKLLGAGDMLYLPPRSADLVRAQGTFVDDHEIHDVVNQLGKDHKPRYSQELIQKRKKGDDRDPSEVDELFDEAAKFMVETQRGSASLLQRRYQIGYTRASRLIDLMAAEGIIGEYKGSQAREVLVTLDELEQRRTEALQARNKNGGAKQ